MKIFRRGHLVPALLGFAIAVAAGALAPAALGASLGWSAPTLVDHRAPFGARFSFAGVSCPSVRLCVAVENAGRILTSRNPGAPRSAWRLTSVGRSANASGIGELTGISCPSESLCVAVDTAGDVVSSSDPGAASPRWRVRQVDPNHELTDISCASRILCVAVGSAGEAVTSRNPTSPASTWHHQRIERGRRTPSSEVMTSLTGVSCPSTHLCVAIDRDGNVVSSRDPVAARPSWRFSALHLGASVMPEPLFSAPGHHISCASSTLCVIASGQDLATSTAPSGGTSAWVAARVESGFANFSGVQCRSRSLCVAVDTAGNAFASTRPAAGPTEWAVSAVDPAAVELGGLAAVSCPSSQLCLVADHAGDVASARHPAAGESAWRLRSLNQGYTAIQTLSCPTASLCVGYDNAGNVLASTHPASRASAWSVFGLDAGPISSLACLPGPFCFGLAGSDVLTSRDPTGGPAAWATTHVDSANIPAAISCPSESLCVVVESGGNVAVSTDPTGGPGAWQVTHADAAVGFECDKYGDDSGCDPALDSVSCPSTSFCAASDGLGGDVIASSDPTATSAWTIARLGDAPSFGYVTCPSTELCLKFDDYSDDLKVADSPAATSAWRTVHTDASSDGLSGLTCASTTRCVAYDDAGNVVTSHNPLGAWTTTRIDSNYNLSVTCSRTGLCIAFDPRGNVLTSRSPAGGRRAWSRAHVDDEPVTAASCPSSIFCVAADGYGNIIVGTRRSARP